MTPVVCSFCGTAAEGASYWPGNACAICAQCARTIGDDLQRRQRGRARNAEAAVGALLDRVVGQEDAKRVIASSLRRHYRAGANVRSPRVLIAGPPGCGKSALAGVLASLPAPVLHVHPPALAWLERGGEGVPAFLGRLRRADPDRDASSGLLVLDGFDPSADRAAFEAVQRELLGLLDGRSIDSRAGPREDPAPTATSRVFILAIATIPRDAVVPDERAQRERLRSLGFIAPFLARFDRVAGMPALDLAAAELVLARLVARENEALRGTGELSLTAGASRVLAAAAAADPQGGWVLEHFVRALAERADGRVTIDETLARAHAGASATGPYR